ncbi:MAG TPA: GMP synthase [Candidatus Omnitrophica bacterium]|nr:GMP synthase [Candidatus Omnitrophota bacterium]HCI44740.1 GMP synthase [Candidatus Omnitrophota bacterium]
MILILKHVEIEGPETIGRFFTDEGFEIRVLDLYKGDRLPGTFDHLDAVVSLGGPMNVYEEDKYPFLKEENVFLRGVLERGIPFMGICLGGQLIAKASGSKVGRSPEKEIGFSPVQLTAAGKKDPLFQGVAEPLDVFQWHEDMFEVPAAGTLLASSPACPHQAFRVGPCAYGVQFHIEITDQSIREWSDAYFPAGDRTFAEKKKAMLADYQKKKDQFHDVADKIYANFLEIILTSQRH